MLQFYVETSLHYTLADSIVSYQITAVSYTYGDGQFQQFALFNFSILFKSQEFGAH